MTRPITREIPLLRQNQTPFSLRMQDGNANGIFCLKLTSANRAPSSQPYHSTRNSSAEGKLRAIGSKAGRPPLDLEEGNMVENQQTQEQSKKLTKMKKKNSGHEPTPVNTTKEHVPRHLNSASSTSPLHTMRKKTQETKKTTKKPSIQNITNPLLLTPPQTAKSNLNHEVQPTPHQNKAKEK